MMKLIVSTFLLALWQIKADIVVENDVIVQEDVFDFIVLEDSDHWWENRNVTKYYCIMRSLWNPQNHPNKFPQLARMSNPLIYSGRKEFRPWLINRQTTIGVEKLAETGFTDKFRYEIEAAGQNVFKISEGQGFFIDKEDPEKNYAFLEEGIEVSKDYQFLSGIAAIQPSPDWYTGFYLLDTIDEYDRTFFNRMLIHTYPWDAGTDEGDSYNSIDLDLDPPINVQRISKDNAPPEGIFLSPDGKEVLPTAEWDCILHVCPGEGVDCVKENWPPANGCDLLKYPGCENECNPEVERCQECKPKAKDGNRQVFYKNCCQSNYEPIKGGECTPSERAAAPGVSMISVLVVAAVGALCTLW